MSRWLAAWRTLNGLERARYARHVQALGWKVTDEQREYVIESVRAGRKPEIARLSQLASIPDDAALYGAVRRFST